MSKHLPMDVRVPIEEGNPAIRRIESLLYDAGNAATYVKSRFPWDIIMTW